MFEDDQEVVEEVDFVVVDGHRPTGDIYLLLDFFGFDFSVFSHGVRRQWRGSRYAVRGNLRIRGAVRGMRYANFSKLIP